MRRPCGLDAGFALPQLSLHRGRLQGVLLRRGAASGSGRTRCGPGTGVVGFEQDAAVCGRCSPTAADASASGDVLVAADGIHSTVRSVLYPDEGPPRWNGVQMWRGATEWPEFRGGRSMIVAGGHGREAGALPDRAGRPPRHRAHELGGVHPDRPGRRSAAAATGLVAAGRSRPSCAATSAGSGCRTSITPRLIESTAECFEFPMCDRDPLPRWTHGRVTLLGDAAHPMYPMGSNGAGQAVLDAESLARHLPTTRPGRGAARLRGRAAAGDQRDGAAATAWAARKA